MRTRVNCSSLNAHILSHINIHAKHLDHTFSTTIANYVSITNTLPHMKAKFLKFVTSCPRAPLTGFKQLYPPFTISRVNIRRDSERLPTAATCMNLFKLPTYSSKSVMRQKLLISIEANAGFEMS